MTNFMIIVVVAIVVGLAGGYIYRSKKRGAKCIGCPEGVCTCGHGSESSCGGCCGCSQEK